MNTRIAAVEAVVTSLIAAGGLTYHATQKPSDTTLSFVAQDSPGNETMDDLGEPSQEGPDIGDIVAFTQDLTRDGKSAGQAHVAAVGVDHQRRLSQATGTLVLADGDIEVGGVVPMTESFTLVVTGGTGHYAGARGTLDFALKGDRQTLTVHLLKK